jgi:hypothetical protein
MLTLSAKRAFRQPLWLPWRRKASNLSLGSDIDDIPQASQKPGVAYHDPA